MCACARERGEGRQPTLGPGLTSCFACLRARGEQTRTRIASGFWLRSQGPADGGLGWRRLIIIATLKLLKEPLWVCVYVCGCVGRHEPLPSNISRQTFTSFPVLHRVVGPPSPSLTAVPLGACTTSLKPKLQALGAAQPVRPVRPVRPFSSLGVPRRRTLLQPPDPRSSHDCPTPPQSHGSRPRTQGSRAHLRLGDGIQSLAAAQSRKACVP